MANADGKKTRTNSNSLRHSRTKKKIKSHFILLQNAHCIYQFFDIVFFDNHVLQLKFVQQHDKQQINRSQKKDKSGTMSELKACNLRQVKHRK